MRTLAFLAVAWSIPAHAATLTIADIEITYDAARWEVSTGERAAWFRCIGPDCRQDATIAVVAVPAAEPVRGEPEGSNRQSLPLWPTAIREIGGIAFAGVRTTDMTCRAATPVMLRAAGIHGSYLYRFASGAAWGCGGIWGVDEGRFEELLSGVSIRAVPPK